MPDSLVKEHLPGEPEIRKIGFAESCIRFVVKMFVLMLLTVISLPFWLLYGTGCWIWGIPPNVPKLRQLRRYFGLAWTVRPQNPELSLRSRAWLSLKLIEKIVTIPLQGCAWFLDELFYGRKLNAVKVEDPLIEISAGRSGSTQIARYLENDPELVAPNLLQIMIPYLWVWSLARRFLDRDSVREKARSKITALMPPEAVERHELDPFRTDTFDGALFSFHLNHLAPSLGPKTMIEDFNFAKSAPHNQKLWEETFVALTDRIARKTLLFAKANRDVDPPRFFMKGHFLCGAEALDRKYPDATFLTVIREPAPRFKSAINYLRVNPSDPMIGPVPWTWLSEAILQSETDYCEVEQEWFSKTDGANRCVIRFSSFVEDLEGTMETVFCECLGRDSVPDHVPKEHPPRERQHYSVNRSLVELGIDEAELNSRLAVYREWCQSDS